MYSIIIPNHLQEELIQMGEDITRHTFRIGDIILLIYDFVETNKMDCSRRDIWRAVGALVGKAATTIQGYAALAEFYPQSVRKHYEILSSNHFRVAMRIESKTEINWQEVLDYAMSKVDDYGRPATVDELYKVFLYGGEEYDMVEERMGMTNDDPVVAFMNLVYALQRQVQLLPVSEAVRMELLVAVRDLENVLAVV